MPCRHTLPERAEACTVKDLCPLCLKVELEETKAQRDRLRKIWLKAEHSPNKVQILSFERYLELLEAESERNEMRRGLQELLGLPIEDEKGSEK